MGKNLEVINNGESTEIRIDSFPDTCPLCQRGMDPRFYNGILTNDTFPHAELLFQCPFSDCQHLFIGYYYTQPAQGNLYTYFLLRTEPTEYYPREFNKALVAISKNFVTIYNQSKQSEKLNLLEVCGPGYRKSLEFLIKDFVISKYPDRKEEVIKLKLGRVINEFIDNAKIKEMAKRAAWLGNDETHYYRIWEDKDLDDLKNLIELTVHWIEMDLITDGYTESMPDIH